jgi:hypothetical protein
MRKTVLLVSVGLLAMSAAAFAQTATGPHVVATNAGTTVANAPKDATQENGAGVRAQLKGNLEKGGFTDVTVMADAYLVQATDKSGNRVTMFINPDSMTVVTDGKRAAPAKN